MRLVIKKQMSDRIVSRLTKKARVRKKIRGSDERPRLCVFRSAKHIYAQVINDATGKTLFSVSSLNTDGKGTGKEVAQKVGQEIAKLATAKNVKNVVFDRNGYLYHGRVKSLAEGAREGGLNF